MSTRGEFCANAAIFYEQYGYNKWDVLSYLVKSSGMDLAGDTDGTRNLYLCQINMYELECNPGV